MDSDALQVLDTRDDLAQFTPNHLILFALELRFQIQDIVAVAATSITDGSKDRKCDVVYVDSASRTAIIGQSYIASNTQKQYPPSNKAADLNSAASWILGNERPDDLGTSLRAAAEELHSAILEEEVDSIELWYCHNLTESKNAQDELERATATAKALVASNRAIDIRSVEIGRATLDEWYSSTRTPILVTDEIEVPTPSWFEESGEDWSALCTSVPASWLHEMYETYGDRLFSANVRGYMPRRKSSQNINYGIESTARAEPGRFWAFNNGVTALVHRFDAKKRSKKVRLSGIAIVNGAQTTGSLGRVPRDELANARVMIRFVQASDNDLIEHIIRYNNSQNQIKPSDFRSGDRTQKRLREEFQHIPDVTYFGARRGGEGDRARRPSNLIPSDTAAQSLAAFHQNPTVAYHALSDIWEKNDIYDQFFSDHTSASHIVFCYSLLRAATQAKANLTSKDEADLTQDDREALDFLRKRGSIYLLVAAIANGLEIYLDKAVPDSFAASFGKRTTPLKAVENWAPLVDSLLPIASSILDPIFNEGGIRRRDTVTEYISTFRNIVKSTRRGNAETFSEFAETVEI
ncbi:AIPR family protein [Tsukamurella sp. DT100]|uniref:AIPR family protein n=1 Tax=Tsukamurella sp. DT100 TaxID=3393415 RepID=UPI003CF80A12